MKQEASSEAERTKQAEEAERKLRAGMTPWMPGAPSMPDSGGSKFVWGPDDFFAPGGMPRPGAAAPKAVTRKSPFSGGFNAPAGASSMGAEKQQGAGKKKTQAERVEEMIEASRCPYFFFFFITLEPRVE